jgi:hypothetical protein
VFGNCCDGLVAHGDQNSLEVGVSAKPIKETEAKLQDQCKICLPVCHRVGIARPADLQKFIPSIRSLRMKGNLIEIRDKLEISHFATFQEYGPWEDYIHHEFECSHCGRRFLLSVCPTSDPRAWPGANRAALTGPKTLGLKGRLN